MGVLFYFYVYFPFYVSFWASSLMKVERESKGEGEVNCVWESERTEVLGRILRILSG